MGGHRASRLSLGPVFASEWLTSSRRVQGYAVRSVFVLFLLGALVLIWNSHRNLGRPLTTFQQMAELGSSFYSGVIGTQLVFVLLAAPAATAGAICIDRARGTMTHMLVTDLTDSEIVLGKLAARLVPVLGLVGCTLPVMALLTLFGGVDPAMLWGATLVTLGVAVLGCSLAFLFSIWAGKTHEALLATYAVWFFWLLGPGSLTFVLRSLGSNRTVYLEKTNPFILALSPVGRAGAIDTVDFVLFLVGTVGLSGLIAALAVWRLRPVCRQDYARKPWRRWGPTLAAPRWVRRVQAALAPSLDSNPVYWRECARTGGSRWGRTLFALYVVASVFFALVLLFGGNHWDAIVIVNGLHVSVGLLAISIGSGTSLSEERTRGSLDVLMTTTLSTREIVMGKWLGSFRKVPWLAVIPSLLIMSLGQNPGLSWLGVCLMVGCVLSTGAAFTSIGLAIATWVPRVGRAVTLSAALCVFATIGFPFVVAMFCGPRPYGEGLIMGSPLVFAGMISEEATRQNVADPHGGYAVLWMLLYTTLAVGFLRFTLSTFNKKLGRVEIGLPLMGRYAARPRKPEGIEEIVGETVLVH